MNTISNVSVPTPFGINATYFVITNLSLDNLNNRFIFVVYGYLDQNSFNSGAASLINFNFSNSNSNDFSAMLSAPDFMSALNSYVSNLLNTAG